MSNEEPSGCLFAIFRLFGFGGGTATGTALPYRLRDDFLSPAELSFYKVLQLVVKDRATISTKVNLADLFFVPRGEGQQSYRNKIDRKHVDFLLCDPVTMRPLAGLELDDSSHQRADRIERDQFVDAVFQSAGLPLLHFPVRQSYNVAELSAFLAPLLSPQARPLPPPTPPIPTAISGPPNCPKCGTPMVQRTATKGDNKGRMFWGCANYPKCREVR